MPVYGQVDGVERIAVLRANGVGDYVVALPALDALRGAYPQAEIALVGAPWHARFLAGRPGPVDRVHVLPPVPGMPGHFEGAADPAELERFLAGMRAERFDLAVQLHGGGRHSNRLVRAFGARVTAGPCTADAEPLDRWVHYDYFQHEVFRYLEVVALVGAPPIQLEPTLEPTADEEQEAGQVLLVAEAGERGPLVALHPGATDPRRRWPAERFAAVGDALTRAGADVVVTGGPGDGDLPERVVTAMRGPATLLADRLSLGGLVALLARCAVVVANDTGPLHIAQAVGTRTAGVYWCGNLAKFGPVSRGRHRPQVSWVSHCPVCGAHTTVDVYPARDEGARQCEHRVSFVTDVPVDEVRDAALDLLGHWQTAFTTQTYTEV